MEHYQAPLNNTKLNQHTRSSFLNSYIYNFPSHFSSTWCCVSFYSCLGVSCLEQKVLTGSRFGRFLLPAYWQCLTDHITAMLTPTLDCSQRSVVVKKSEVAFFLLISVKAWQGLTPGYKNLKPPLSWSAAFRECVIYWTSGFQPKGWDLSKGSEDKSERGGGVMRLDF